MTRRQVEKEMAAVGLVPKEIIETLPQQHLMIFQKTNSRALKIIRHPPYELTGVGILQLRGRGRYRPRD
jgi:hypothetical protein